MLSFEDSSIHWIAPTPSLPFVVGSAESIYPFSILPLQSHGSWGISVSRQTFLPIPPRFCGERVSLHLGLCSSLYHTCMYLDKVSLSQVVDSLISLHLNLLLWSATLYLLFLKPISVQYYGIIFFYTTSFACSMTKSLTSNRHVRK